MSSNSEFWEIPVEPGKLDGFDAGRALWSPPEERPSNTKLLERRRNAIAALRDLVDRGLTERQRECVRLYFYEGRTQQQVADELGICRRVVSQHLFGICRDGRRVGGAMKRIRKLCRQRGLRL